MGKDDKCCVPFCGNRRKLKRSLSYYRIPQNPVQRVAWLDVIHKDPATIAANDRVCSVHFVSGKPSPFSQNVDWKPTLCIDKKEEEKDEMQTQSSYQNQIDGKMSSAGSNQIMGMMPLNPLLQNQNSLKKKNYNENKSYMKQLDMHQNIPMHSPPMSNQDNVGLLHNKIIQELGPITPVSHPPFSQSPFPSHLNPHTHPSHIPPAHHHPSPAFPPMSHPSGSQPLQQASKPPTSQSHQNQFSHHQHHHHQQQQHQVSQHSLQQQRLQIHQQPQQQLQQQQQLHNLQQRQQQQSMNQQMQTHAGRSQSHTQRTQMNATLSDQRQLTSPHTSQTSIQMTSSQNQSQAVPTVQQSRQRVSRSVATTTATTTSQTSQRLTVTTTTAAKIGNQNKSSVTTNSTNTTKNESHGCVLCNEKLPSKEALQEHFRSHANGEGFAPVRVMDRPIASSGANKNSNSSASGIETWTCDICGRVFTSKSSYLTHHMRYHPQETGHYCPHCGRMFPLRVDRDRHLLSHVEKGPYTQIPCPVCKVDFYNEEAVAYHMQNHQKVQEITSRASDNPDYLDDLRPSKRLRFDSMGEPQFCYYCPWCGKEYIQRYNLESHVRKMHQTMAKAERLFYCETCDSTFYNQSALMQHNFGHQQNQGYLINPSDGCKPSDMDEEMNLLTHILPMAASNSNSNSNLTNSLWPAGTTSVGSSKESKSPSVWPDWMNALPVELLRAIKQDPNSPPSSGNSDGAANVTSSYPCLECRGNFPTMVALRQHRCLPGKDNPMIKNEACDLTCGVCSSSFSSESELADHLLTHEVYLCSECGEELPNKTQYLEHQTRHSNNGELRIPLNAFLPENDELRKKVLGEVVKKKVEVKKKETNEGEKKKLVEKNASSNLMDKIEENGSEKEVESKDSVKKIETNTNKESNNSEQFVCGLCDQHFPDQASLEVHFKEMGDHASHNSRFSVTCNVCGLSFTVEAFKKHTHTSRPSDAQRTTNSIPIKCGICQENFSTKEEIDAHFASHPETARDASRRSFLCNVCVAEDPALALLASFSTLRELYDHHARQHPQMSSNYQCRLCGMRFFEQWDLASHFAKHLPENIRNQCQVVFKNGQLKATFVCERCNQVFNYEVHLANHLRNNTCLKWACHICGKGNRSAKHRNQHIREHHPVDGLRYLCGVDGCKRKETFSKRVHVYAHLRSKHANLLQNGESGKEVSNEELDTYVITEEIDKQKKDSNDFAKNNSSKEQNLKDTDNSGEKDEKIDNDLSDMES